jgi:hypothetical protein
VLVETHDERRVPGRRYLPVNSMAILDRPATGTKRHDQNNSLTRLTVKVGYVVYAALCPRLQL